MPMQFKCATCGQNHTDLPDIGSDRPFIYWDVPERERGRRITLTADTCIIDNQEYFIRGVIEIHVHNYAQSLGFGVWVSLKRENYHAYVQNPDSAEIGPYFGWPLHPYRVLFRGKPLR